MTPRPLVLDASSALAWLVERTDPGEFHIADEALSETQKYGAIVPSVWWLEVINGALVSERRGGDKDKTALFFGLLSHLPIDEDEWKPRSLHLSILDLSRKYSLTSYDSLYLELALRRHSPLATFDRKLAHAARAAGIPIFGDPS